MKTLLICNIAPHYRTAIFKELDEVINCDFVFGDKVADIKKMDYGLLKHQVSEVRNVGLKFCYYQKGVPKLIFSNYNTYIMTGDTRCISTWIFLVFSLFFPKKNVYLWSHGWLGNESVLVKIVSKLFYKMATGTFVYNNHSRQLMIKGGISEKKLTTVYNSLDYDTQLCIRKECQKTDVFNKHFKNSNKNIVFIGRLTEVKRLDLLLDAIDILKQRGVAYNLTLIGDGNVYKSLKLKSVNLGLEDVVWFYGASYDESKNAELLYNSDLCVSPGNIGLTAMHAMMFGCPCMTHDDFSSQMPEYESILPGITGCFFKKSDAQSMAACMEDWFANNGGKRGEVRSNCYKMIDEIWNLHNQIDIMKTIIDC